MVLVIYFDFRPKETKEDLFDREEELNKLISSSMTESIILLTGMENWQDFIAKGLSK